MNKDFKTQWREIVHDYSKKLAKLDDTNLSDEELSLAMKEAGDASAKMTEFGYYMANDLDNVKRDLFTKWWFKLFTKLQL